MMEHLQYRLPADVLDHVLIPYLYADFESIVRAGDLYVLQREKTKWLYPFDKNNWKYTEIASTAGCIPILEWLYQNGAAFAKLALAFAAEGGRLEVVKWLHARGLGGSNLAESGLNEIEMTRAMDWAAGGGHLEVVKWLACNHYKGHGTWAIEWAAEYGRQHVVDWLRANIPDFSGV